MMQPNQQKQTIKLNYQQKIRREFYFLVVPVEKKAKK
jgi:hypothetical protein